MIRRAYRKDRNHGEVKTALEGIGVGVYDAASDGSPYDLLVFSRGMTVIVEAKDGLRPPSERRLSDKEQRLHNLAAAHGVKIHVVESVDDALAIFGAKITA